MDKTKIKWLKIVVDFGIILECNCIVNVEKMKYPGGQERNIEVSTPRFPKYYRRYKMTIHRTQPEPGTSSIPFLHPGDPLNKLIDDAVVPKFKLV